MYKIYFKQALEMLKQNKFISIITIAGTALAIMMIMVILVAESIKNTSVAPEINRDRTLYIKNNMKIHKKLKWQNSESLSFSIYKDYLSDIKTAEFSTVVMGSKFAPSGNMVKSETQKKRLGIELMQTDANYWKLMSFNFIGGKPYTQEDFSSGLKNAVVSQTMARKLFGSDQVVGKDIEIDFNTYKIIGVVKDVSRIFEYAYADIWIPYTSKQGYDKGYLTLLILAKDKADFPAIEQEVRAAEKKHDSLNEEWEITLWGPYDHRAQLLNVWSNEGVDMKRANRRMAFILGILLLVPAVNLTSFSLSRIKRRREEIGVRKAFGAKKYIILIQVLYENLVTSLIGGVIGLILSYIVVIWLKQWLLGVDVGAAIPISTLISLPVFFAVFVVCLLINLLSAGIPAYKASRIKIVDSLTQKEL